MPASEVKSTLRRRFTEAHCAEALSRLTGPDGESLNVRRDKMKRVLNDLSWRVTSHPRPMIPGLTSGPGDDGLLQDWYSGALLAMHEPRLTDEPGIEAYRLIWLRTFHHPVAVRIERRGSNYTVVRKELDGQGGYDLGRLSIDEKRELSPAQWNDFVEVYGSQMSARPSKKPSGGKDGAEWLIESIRADKHHFAVRWSPLHDPTEREFASACLRLLELGGAKPDKDLY